MSDLSIRPITIAEHAEMAAARTAESGVIEANPHPLGSVEHSRWKAAYCRFLLLHTAPEGVEGGA